jgi:prepilin-type N-terminal cleavage/methylation domain-containing protein
MRNSKLKHLGFTLIEMLVVVGLFSLIVSIGSVNLSKAPRRAGTKSGAELLASELRYARSEAMRRHAPVAICVPSTAGTTYNAKGVYWIAGSDKPKNLRSLDLTQSVPDCCVFQGYWPLNAASLGDPSSLSSNDSPRQGAREDGFDLSKWVLPNPQDGALIFTPSGSVTSNGLVHFDGAYHLVVCDAVTASAGSPGFTTTTPLTYFLPSRMGNPNTVAISFRGDVQVSPGLTGTDGSVALDGGDTNRTGLPPVSLGINSIPTVNPAEVVLTPTIDSELLPPGTGSLVPVDRHLTLTVRASDPDGDPLSIKWSCSGGKFSESSVSRRMSWNQNLQRWESIVQWQTPPGANPGDPFDLSCDITDGKGGSVTLNKTTIAAFGVKTASKGKLISTNRYDSVVTILNPDGSGMREVNLPGPICSICPTLDGEHLIFSYYTGALSGTIASFKIADGTHQKLLLNGGLCEPSVSTAGRIAAQGGNGIVVMNGDGSNSQQITSAPGYGDGFPRWSPDDSKLAFSRGTNQIHLINPDGSGDVTLAAGDSPLWSPDGSKIYFLSGSDIIRMNADGSGQTVVVSSAAGGVGNSFSLSPDGTQLAWIVSYNIYVANEDGSNAKRVATLAQGTTLQWTR